MKYRSCITASGVLAWKVVDFLILDKIRLDLSSEYVLVPVANAATLKYHTGSFGRLVVWSGLRFPLIPEHDFSYLSYHIIV